MEEKEVLEEEGSARSGEGSSERLRGVLSETKNAMKLYKGTNYFGYLFRPVESGAHVSNGSRLFYGEAYIWIDELIEPCMVKRISGLMR